MDKIDGKSISEYLLAQLKQEIVNLGIKPVLKVILVGDNEASKVYVKNKNLAAAKVGIFGETIHLPNNITKKELIELLDDLNKDLNVNGILVQLPVPEQIGTISDFVSPIKDVDCFHTTNVGKLYIGNDVNFLPCTPAGCIYLINTVLQNLTGLNAVIVGRSNIVGKPMAQILLNKNCTVTIAHSKTKNLDDVISLADIVIAAVGKPNLIEKVKDNAVVIDVGINRTSDNRLVGDVNFDKIQNARAATPVPGGVGPMTIAMLLINTLKAFCMQNRVNSSLIKDIYGKCGY